MTIQKRKTNSILGDISFIYFISWIHSLIKVLSLKDNKNTSIWFSFEQTLFFESFKWNVKDFFVFFCFFEVNVLLNNIIM